MEFITQISARLFPRRHRRKWKYVSPRRRKSGIVIFMFLVVLLYSGWYFTRSDFVRENAIRALEKMTGCDVQIDSARFGFLEGIQMTGVKVTLKNNGAEPFFTADVLKLKFDTWELLTAQKIKPTFITCSGFELTNTRYLDTASKTKTDTMNKLLQSAKVGKASTKKPKFPADLKLPRIELRNGNFRAIVNQGDVSTVVYNEPVSCTLEPKSKQNYLLTISETRPDKIRESHISLDIDIANSKIAPISGTLVNPLVYFVPGPYYDWIDYYGLHGEFYHQAGEDEGTSIYHIRNVSVKLPEAHGEATLTATRGKLIFAKDGVKIEDVVGSIQGVKSTNFRISGAFEGYSKNSPFQLNVRFPEFKLPAAGRFAGELDATIRNLHDVYKPEGISDLELTFTRDDRGQFAFSGIARPKNMSGTYKGFDLPVHNITGELHFTNKRIKKFDLYAQRGQTRFTVRGTLDGYYQYAGMDLTISATDLELDLMLRRAVVKLDRRYADTWKTVAPAGKMDAKVRLIQPDREPELLAEIDAMPKGFASMRYAEFPYKLNNLSGLVTLRGDTVKIQNLESRDDASQILIEGEIQGLQQGKPSVELMLTANSVPIDDKLIRVLPAQARQQIRELKLTGKTGLITGKILQKNAGQLDYNFSAALLNATLDYDKFPYKLTSGAGKVFIKPGLVKLEDFTAKHGDSTIEASAQFVTSGEKLDYVVNVTGRDVAFDNKLKSALPAAAQLAFSRFKPAGKADIFAQVTSPIKPTEPNDYTIKILPRLASINHADFPYKIANLTGAVVITPDEIAIQNIKFSHDKMTGSVAGIVDISKQRTTGELKLSLQNLQLDKKLLSAMPPSWAKLSKKFKPGGSCSIPNAKFIFSEVVTRPGLRTEELSNWDWKMVGKVNFIDANIDVGLGKQPITGSFDGTTQNAAGKLILKSKVSLARATVGKYSVTNLTGDMSKALTSDVVHLENVLGKVFDGRIAGKASIWIKDDLKYGLRMEFKDVDMQKFVNAGEKDKAKWSKVIGKLSGKVDIVAGAKAGDSRQAVGEIYITKAKMYKLPVILDVLNVIYLTVPGDSAFNRGVISYHLKGDKLFLQEIHLSGQTISVLGSGTLDMKTGKLDLTFLTGQSGKLPRLQNVTDEILRALLKEIVEIRVTGTLKNPKMETLNLRSVRMLMERLIIKMPQ